MSLSLLAVEKYLLEADSMLLRYVRESTLIMLIYNYDISRALYNWICGKNVISMFETIALF